LNPRPFFLKLGFIFEFLDFPLELLQASAFGYGQLRLSATLHVGILDELVSQSLGADPIGLGHVPDRLGGADYLPA
jgi:hypothetical protein